MHSTTHEHPSGRLHDAWRHVVEVFRARSVADAWNSFKRAVEATPAWALVVLVVAAVMLVAEADFLGGPLAAVVFLAALYFTIKHAMLAAWRERDQEGSS